MVVSVAVYKIIARIKETSKQTYHKILMQSFTLFQTHAIFTLVKYTKACENYLETV